MIELTLTGCCKECPHIDLCTEVSDFYADGSVIKHTVRVSCSHEQVCGKRQAELKNERGEQHD